MTEFKATEIYKAPKLGPKSTADTAYWKKLEFPIAVKDYGPIDYVSISHQEPYDFAVTCSAKVQIYNRNNNQISRTISRFIKAAYGAIYRQDGKLLACGTEEGMVSLFDVQSKSQLRLFKGHKGPTHRCSFLNEGNAIASFSDDKTACIWDIAAEAKITSLIGHTDYIRAGAVNPGNNSTILTGGYDHIVKMFDIRSADCVLSVDHGAPVEDVKIFPSGSLFISAGGTLLKVWDAVNGRLLAQLSQHHKTITCLQFASNNKRLMSGSLDRQVKIYDTLTYQVVHTIQYPSPILSMAVSGQDQLVVAGMADGLISIRHRKQEKEKKTEEKPNFRFRMYGNQFKPADVTVASEEKTKELNRDRFLRTFQSSKTLDAALKDSVMFKQPEIGVSVMQELIRRGSLLNALEGRDSKTLSPITKFLSKNLPDPRYSRTLLDVANMLVDLYGPNLGDCPKIRQQFDLLQLVMDKELKYIKEMIEVNGILQCILSVANSHKIDLQENQVL